MRALFGLTVLAIGCFAFGALHTAEASDSTPVSLPFRAFLPGMASDNSPSNLPGTTLVSAEHLSQRVDGGLVISGEVLNDSPANITGAQVRVTLRRNGVSATKDTVSFVRIIPPGGVGPFQVFFAGVTDTNGTISADVTGFGPATEPAIEAMFAISGPYPFQIGPPDAKSGVIPYSNTLEQLRGLVTNDGGLPLAEMDTVIVAYDGSGNVAFVTTGTEPTVPFQEAGDAAVLPPGQTGSFIAGIPIGLLLKVQGDVTLKGFLNATPEAQ